MKKVLAVVAGVITGGVLTAIAESVAHAQYEPPVLTSSDMTPLVEFLENLPVQAWLILIIGWLIAGLGAGIVASLIGKEHWKRSAIITGSILLAFMIFNFIMIPHPIWVAIIVALAYIPVVYFGAKLVAKKA